VTADLLPPALLLLSAPPVCLLSPSRGASASACLPCPLVNVSCRIKHASRRDPCVRAGYKATNGWHHDTRECSGLGAHLAPHLLVSTSPALSACIPTILVHVAQSSLEHAVAALRARPKVAEPSMLSPAHVRYLGVVLHRYPAPAPCHNGPLRLLPPHKTPQCQSAAHNTHALVHIRLRLGSSTSVQLGCHTQSIIGQQPDTTHAQSL
jgi:hypothetical protein